MVEISSAKGTAAARIARKCLFHFPVQQTAGHPVYIYVYIYTMFSCVFRVLPIFIFFCILHPTKQVLTWDYLYLNNETHFAKPLEMSLPGAGRKTRNKNRVKLS